MSAATPSNIRNEDLLALQAYVRAADATQYDDVHKDTVILDLTHSNLRQRHAETRFDLHDTLDTLRAKIHQKTGTPPVFQHLQFYRGRGPAGAAGNTHELPFLEIPPGIDDDRMLGYYSLMHGITVHCVDLDEHSASRGGQYEDVSLVEKYQMSDEEYNKRKGTLRDWARKEKDRDATFSLAKHAREHRELMDARRLMKEGLPLPPGFEVDASTGDVVRVQPEPESSVTSKKSEEKKDDINAPGPESVEGVEVGMRCEVSPGGRRGSVAFVGEVPEIGVGGYWVGVVFDEPVGKTDGTVRGGKRYFDAPSSNRGGFVQGKNIQVGDFPERDIFDELDSDSEDEL